MTKKLWSGRFSVNTKPDVEHYTASIHFDCELVYEDILGSLAHALMLKKCGLIQENDYSQLEYGLKKISQSIGENKFNFRIEDEDIHMNIERLLSDVIGNVAGKLHTARSRNDQIALDMHLYLRKKTVGIVELLMQLQQTLFTLAKEHNQTIFPGFTHLQRAQPIHLSDHFSAYISMFQRDIARLLDNWKRLNISPLGACALTGTTLPIDSHYVASLLGFDGVYLNAMDAVSDRDFLIEFLAASSLIMMHLSRLSEELILWASTEFNFITFSDAYSTGSSLMPQKKNPDVPELARGKTGRVYGSLLSLLTIMKGLPLAYNKDLQEDKEPLFDTIHTLQQTLSIYSSLLASLQINTEHIKKSMNNGYLNATALADYLVNAGVPFREAHETVGKVVAFCINKNCPLDALSLTEMKRFSLHIKDNVFEAITPENILARYSSNNDLAIYKEQAKLNQSWLAEKKNLLHAIYAKFAVPLTF